MSWYVQHAPVRLKLAIAFGVQFGLVALAGIGGAAWGHLACIVALGASAVAGVVFRAAIADPYVTTVVRMEALAAGDTESPIQFTSYTDCVGRLTVAMDVFRKNIVARQRAEAEAEAARAAAEAQRLENERERAATAASQKQVVDALAKALISFAKGDLTQKINEFFAEEYKSLRMDFNMAASRMESTMRSVIHSTRSVSAGSHEINGAASDLARRIEQQAAQLEQSATTLTEVTGTVDRTSQNAKAAAQLAGAARADASASAAVVRETVGAMTGIEASSRQIANIIGVIDEIAFQTNLLALNAGVEAARAGDAGRGFTVVATEVRALAQRSADAAKEIKALITASGDQVGSGVKLVNETGQTLERITSQINELAELVVGIAEAAEEQASALKQVSQAVNQMDRVTQENAAMIEETTAASASLTSEAATLASLMGEFKIGDGPVEPQRQAAPAARPAEVRKPERAMAAAQGEGTDWNEF